MEIFDGLEKFLNISYHLPRPNESLKKLTILWHNVILSGLLGCSISLFWFLFFREKTFSEFTEALYMLNTSVLNFVNILLFIYNRSFFYQLIDTSRSIIRKRCENPASKEIYKKVIKSIEKWTALAINCMAYVNWPLLIIPPVAISCIIYLLGKSDAESIQLPFPGAFPYQTTLIGYLFALAVQSIGMYGVILTCSLVLILLLFGWNISAFVDDIELSLNDLTQSLTIYDKLPAFDRKINDKFREFLQLQIDASQFSEQFSDAFKNIALGYLLWSTFCICCSLIMFQKLMSSVPYMDLILMYVCIFWSFFQAYLVCNMGETITNRLQDAGEALYQTTWYLLPIRIQKALPISLMIAEKPVYIEAFGSISCTREMYQKLVNKSFSFFMVLRQFEF